MSKSKADFAESSFNKFLVIHGIDREHGYVQRILEILDNVGPTTQDVQKKTQFVTHIQPIIIKHFKEKFNVDCEPVVVGSFTTGFDVEGSDLDMTIILPEPVSKDVNIQMIDSLKEELEKDEAVFRKFFVMRWGAVPILKIKAQDDTKCDICINNYLGRANSNMLRLYATFDPRLHKLGLFMKMWAKTLEIGESGHSGLNSYTFIIMCIAYMQSRNMLPNLQDETLCAGLEKKKIGSFDCTYMQDLDQVPWAVTDTTPLHELIAGFMRWLLEFDYNNSAISIRCGGSVPFKEEKTLAIIHIEDPFELRDLGASMSPAKFLKLREELLKAYVIITGDSSYVPPEVVNTRLSQWLKKNKTK